MYVTPFTYACDTIRFEEICIFFACCVELKLGQHREATSFIVRLIDINKWSVASAQGTI